MARKRFSVEQMINHLREAEVLLAPVAWSHWLVRDCPNTRQARRLGSRCR